jgi:hypothetical protein
MGIWRDRAAFPHQISLPTPQSFPAMDPATMQENQVEAAGGGSP